MKKHKYLFIVFYLSSFLFLSNVMADYKATVINPQGAKCSYLPESTGYCFYSDSNLNNYTDVVKWLDNGDEVTVLTDYKTVPTKNTSLCSDYYVYATFQYTPVGKKYYGYYCNANLTTGILTDELKTEFTNLGFPSSYHEKLAILKTAHPEWEFRSIDTNLDFKEAVNSLGIASRSLVQKSASNNYAYLATDSASFDYYNDKYIPYDASASSNPWYNANYDTIAYYLDPRNFLSDMYIFQFELLAYDNTISDSILTNTISTIFNGDYLNKFTSHFITAGKESKVSPVYLASLSKQEVGGYSTATSAVSGKVSGYEGYYNFYNIGAYSGDSPVLNGLTYSKGNEPEFLRPWNSEYNAIVGGAKWISKKYIGVGQNTSYFKKWNVVYNYLINLEGENKIENPYSNYTHQYMTNIMAPSSEATYAYSSYASAGIANNKFVFYIPVFNNMPTTTNLPTNGGWPNNYLKTLSIGGKNIASFKGDDTKYNYYLDINTSKVKIDATPINNSAKISGLGEFVFTENKTHIVKVTAQNGNVKEYKINIILTGEKIENPIDIVTTLNNAGIKNGNKYLSGFNLGTDISYIKEKVLNSNSTAIIELKNSSGTIKNTGVLATGDKVKITVGNESKEYDVVIYGDVNGDGKITAVDYAKVKNNVLGKINLNDSYKEAADINKNGETNPSDYAKIKNYVLGKGQISQ